MWHWLNVHLLILLIPSLHLLWLRKLKGLTVLELTHQTRRRLESGTHHGVLVHLLRPLADLALIVKVHNRADLRVEHLLILLLQLPQLFFLPQGLLLYLALPPTRGPRLVRLQVKSWLV
jgi:hypothetical protein